MAVQSFRVKIENKILKAGSMLRVADAMRRGSTLGSKLGSKLRSESSESRSIHTSHATFTIHAVFEIEHGFAAIAWCVHAETIASCAFQNACMRTNPFVQIRTLANCLFEYEHSQKKMNQCMNSRVLRANGSLRSRV